MKTNIALIGLSGSGKTTIGQELSTLLNMPFFDSDEEIEKEHGNISDLFYIGEDYFRQIESKIIYKLSSIDEIIIATGGGVILTPANIEALKSKATIFYIKRSVDDIYNSINASNRPLVKSNPRDNLKNLYNQRKHLYEQHCDYTIDASRMEDAINSIMSIWTKIT